MDQQSHYVGLDVSLETTSICVIDDAGAIIWRGKCCSDPDTITAIVRQHAPGVVRVGLETGQLSNWLTLSLRRRGVPVVCMDARHAKAALSLQINKTDANDAFGLAAARTRSPVPIASWASPASPTWRARSALSSSAVRCDVPMPWRLTTTAFEAQ